MKNFQILSELGTGSFGKVHLALHSGTGEKVAIKTISKQKLKSKEDYQMVNKQIAIFKTVQHANIIKLYEIIQDSTCLYLVMEHADRGDLLTYIKQNGTLSQHLALMYMKQLAEAVSYLHEQKNIAHRDIKLANILLCSKVNKIKLADFGLSNFYQKDKLLKTSCGSPCYSAPQILLGSKYSPLPADIWSLGVVLYSMIEGCLPFYNENAKQLYKQVIKGKYCQHEKASKQVQQLIRKMLQINPDSRTNIWELIDEISLLLGSQNSLSSIKSVPKLTKQSHDYVEYLRIQHMKKILILKGYQESIVESSFQYASKYNKPRKFNDLNTYMELLNRIPINKLSSMLQTLLNDSKITKTLGDESSLKRNYSSFTRDTLKGSQAQSKAPHKIRFVRNAVPNNKNVKLTESEGIKKTSNRQEEPKKIVTINSNAKHKRKRSDLVMSLNSSQLENNSRLCKNSEKNQLKCGYIRLSNLETQRQKSSFAPQPLPLKNPPKHLSFSLSKQLSHHNSTIENTFMNESVNQSISIATDRSCAYNGCEESEMPVYRGLFNIMRTFNGNLNEKVLVQNLKTKFQNLVVINAYKYQIRDDYNESYEVQIAQVENFRYLKLIKISPTYNIELFNKIKSILHQSSVTR